MAAVLSLLAMHWVLSFITRDHASISDWVKGRPTRIIVDGEGDQDASLDVHMSDDDLLEDVRQKGLRTKGAKEAVLERSGELSVIRAKE